MFYLSIESISRFLLIGSIAVIERLSLRGGLTPNQLESAVSLGFGSLACQVEGGRRTPEAPARTLLTVIDKNPAAVLTALNPAAFAAAVASSKPATVHVKVDRKRQTSSPDVSQRGRD
jgi:hypothetical protein